MEIWHYILIVLSVQIPLSLWAAKKGAERGIYEARREHDRRP